MTKPTTKRASKQAPRAPHMCSAESDCPNHEVPGTGLCSEHGGIAATEIPAGSSDAGDDQEQRLRIPLDDDGSEVTLSRRGDEDTIQLTVTSNRPALYVYDTTTQLPVNKCGAIAEALLGLSAGAS